MKDDVIELDFFILLLKTACTLSKVRSASRIGEEVEVRGVEWFPAMMTRGILACSSRLNCVSANVMARLEGDAR